MEFGLGSTFDSVLKNVIRFNFIIIPIVFYLNAFWLIPAYLKPKKWLKYAFYVILVSLFIKIIKAIFFVFFTEPDGVSSNPLIKAFFEDETLIGMVFLGFIFSFGYRFTKDWIINLTVIEKLKTEKVNMELAFLKSQIDPHFLFNTLNNLYSIALDEQSPTTADGIAKLGTLMRYNLHDSQAGTIPLRKEVEYIKKYVDLQRLRATDKNNIVFNLETEQSLLDTIEIAPLMLIPIIENAFKYGISPTEESNIFIFIKAKGNELNLDVQNTIISISNPKQSSGFGLNNLEERLSMLYPNNHLLEYSEDNNLFRASLMLKLSI